MHGEHETHCLRECRHLLAARREGIVARWYDAIARPTFSPFTESEIRACLRVLVERAIAVLTDASFTPDAAQEIGAALVRLRYLDPGTLRETVAILGEALSEEIPVPLYEVLRARLPALLGAVAAGHERAGRVLILDEQEGIRAALLAERERLTGALRESEARFRAVFADAAIGITLADLEGRAIECNSATERILGYRQDELQRFVFTDLTHPDDTEADREAYDQLVAGERAGYRREKRYLHKHGHVVRCNLTAALVRDAHNAPRFVVGMIEDVTARKPPATDTQEMARRLTERERAVLQRLTEGLTREQVRAIEAISLRTVNRTVADLERKLGAHNPFVLGARAALLGLVSLDEDGTIVPREG